MSFLGRGNMNKKFALILSVVIAISSIFLTNYLIRVNFSIGSKANLYFSMAILSWVSGAMALFIQSKKEQPNIENIGLLVLFNFVGIGICSYAILTNQYDNV